MRQILATALTCVFVHQPLNSPVNDETKAANTSGNSANPLESALHLLGGGHRAIREEPPSATLRGNSDEVRRQLDLLEKEYASLFHCSRLGNRLDGGGEINRGIRVSRMPVAEASRLLSGTRLFAQDTRETLTTLFQNWRQPSRTGTFARSGCQIKSRSPSSWTAEACCRPRHAACCGRHWVCYFLLAKNAAPGSKAAITIKRQQGDRSPDQKFTLHLAPPFCFSPTYTQNSSLSLTHMGTSARSGCQVRGRPRPPGVLCRSRQGILHRWNTDLNG